MQGGGSARDTLSALELLASTGGDVGDVVDLDEFLVALIERDPGRVLTAMGHAVNLGRDPRTVTEDIVRHLRNAFLSIMAPELVVLPPDRVDAIAAQAQQLGAAMLVRAIERLGSALVDMRHAPDPRILVEVALVQLTADDVGTDTDALDDPHRAVGADGQAAPRARGRPRWRRHGAGATRPVHRPGRAGRRRPPRRHRRHAAPAPQAGAPAAPEPAAPEPRRSRTGRSSRSCESRLPASPTDVWHTTRSQLKGMTRARYTAVELVGEAGGVWQFSVPNDATRTKCAEYQADVEAALTAAVGAPVKIGFVVQAGTRPTTTRRAEPTPAPAAAAPPPRRAAPAAPTERAVDRAVAAAAAAVDDEVSPRPSCRPCPTTTTSICPSSPTRRPSRSRPRSTGWPRRSPAPSSCRRTERRISWPACTPLPSRP